MSNPITDAIKDYPGNNGNGSGRQKTIADFRVDARVDAFKEDSTPEEMSEAINRFSNLTVALNPILRKVAQNNLAKKLKDKGINTGASDIARKAFRADIAKDDGRGQGVALDDPEPWKDEVTEVELLEEIRYILKMYTILPEGAAATEVNVTDGKPENPFKNNNFTPVTDEKGGMGEKKENGADIGVLDDAQREAFNEYVEEIISKHNLPMDQTKRLKEVEHENARLKKLAADLSLDNAILKEYSQEDG